MGELLRPLVAAGAARWKVGSPAKELRRQVGAVRPNNGLGLRIKAGELEVFRVLERLEHGPLQLPFKIDTTGDTIREFDGQRKISNDFDADDDLRRRDVGVAD